MERQHSSKTSNQIASVKEAVSLYGQRITRGTPDHSTKTQSPFSEITSSKARDLHLAKKDIYRFNATRTVAEEMRSQAEMEIISARKTVKDLTKQIEESKSKVRAKNSELETLSRSENHGDALNADSHQYAEVMRELKSVKQELSKLKLDMAYLSEMKCQADEETDVSKSRIRSYSSSIEALKMDIEEANEEQVLVELARIEAFREYEAIEAQRAAGASHFLSTMEETRKRIKDVVHEIDCSKELETKLAIRNSDVDVLQSELKLVKAMDKRLQINGTLGEEQSTEESETLSLLESVKKELDAANKELACIKEEGFEFMASMDIIRQELKHVNEETAQLKKLEEKADSTIEILNSKLVRAKSKMDAVSSAEKKAKAIVLSLTATLQQLGTEAEAARKERELISQEAESIVEETQKNETEIDVAEEQLRVAMEELEAARTSEAIALESLKTLCERTMQARASASEHNSSITISHFEYKYLTGRAEGAEEIADKKVAAAQAWIEALKAGEKEILMKTEIVLKELRELKVAEETEDYRNEKSPTEKTEADDEGGKLRQQGLRKTKENMHLEVALPQKSMRDNGNSTPTRNTYSRRNSSHGVRHIAHSNTIALKKRKKVMPNLVKFFGNNGNEQTM